MQIEFEPEYLMEEFGTNPDIDEKPPIPLQDALEKMKPFLMAYEGIQSQEEWEVNSFFIFLFFYDFRQIENSCKQNLVESILVLNYWCISSEHLLFSCCEGSCQSWCFDFFFISYWLIYINHMLGSVSSDWTMIMIFKEIVFYKFNVLHCSLRRWLSKLDMQVVLPCENIY